MDEKTETGCCPRFNPEPWDEKEVSLTERLFLMDHVWCFLHIPLNMNKIMRKNMELIGTADALASEPLMLYDARSPWRADVYIAVSKDVPGGEMTKISGTFLTKVFEGPYKDCRKWAQEMENYVKSKGRGLEKLYFFYTTCPKCAEAYGENYTVILAKV